MEVVRPFIFLHLLEDPVLLNLLEGVGVGENMKKKMKMKEMVGREEI